MVIRKTRKITRVALVSVLTLTLIFTALPFGSVAMKNDSSPYIASAESISGTGCSFDTTTGTLTVTANSFELPEGVDGRDIKKAVIQSYVSSIGDTAFGGCESLASVTFASPSNLATIGHSAFAWCESLASISIPDSVTTIRSRAFQGCTSLATIHIPAGVENLNSQIFVGCTALTEISVDNANTAYVASDGVLFNKSKTELIQYPAGKSDTSYDIPNSVTTIADGAFGGCISLADVSMPDSITDLGSWTFADCTALTSITLSSDLTGLGHFTFSGCTALTSLIIPDGVTSISDYGVFRGCDALSSITIPSSVTYILDSWVFDSCSPSLILKVDKDSYAHSYAIANNIPFIFTSSSEQTAYTVTFDSNGGTAVATKTVNAGAAIGTLPTPTKTNHTFLGWYTAASGGTKISANTVITGNTTYYAQWELLESTGGGEKPTGGGETSVVNGQISVVSAVVKATPDKPYTGKQIKPVLTVTLGGKTLKVGTDYTVTYGANKAIGKGTATITGKGAYKDTKAVTFNIVPTKLSLSKLTVGKKQVKVAWKAAPKAQGITKYQIRYSLKGKTKWRIVNVSAKSLKTTIKKLTTKKTYQFQIRSYKTVSGANYYAPWSASKVSKKIK